MTAIKDLWPLIIFGYPALLTAIILGAAGIYFKKPLLVVLGSVISTPPSIYLGGTPSFRYVGFGLPIFQILSAFALYKGRLWLAIILLLPIIGCTVWLLFLSIM